MTLVGRREELSGVAILATQAASHRENALQKAVPRRSGRQLPRSIIA
jgi:hypothetical protein